MNTYDYSQVDFSNSEVRKSLARAYAVVLKIRIDGAAIEAATPKEKRVGKEIKEQRLPEQRYYQERMF